MVLELFFKTIFDGNILYYSLLIYIYIYIRTFQGIIKF